MLTECNSTCQKQIFEQEVHQIFFILMDAILNQIQFELSQKKRNSHGKKIIDCDILMTQPVAAECKYYAEADVVNDVLINKKEHYV